MKTKIKRRLLEITAIAIIMTLLMVCYVFYEIFKAEVMQELRNDAQVLTISDFSTDHSKIEQAEILKHLRVTLVSSDGTVKFDNDADTSKMNNHSERPEIKEALANGEGTDIRKSSTLGENTFYVAVRQEDGSVLRVAKDVSSIWSIFQGALPAVIVITVGLFSLCMLIAHYLTKSLIAPIEHMAQDIEACRNISTYKELVPFISTIQKQHDNILKSAKMRQEFTANVSHELKTPLTSISGYAELIESGMASEKDIRRFAGEIQRNSKRLLSLINDIIKLSELDSMDIQVDFEKFNLFEVAQESVDMLQLYGEKHEVEILLTGENCFIQGNKSMMEEVIYNLCDNAIRYNNKGGKVFVEVNKERDQAVLSVRDTGIGICKKDQERIFERFYRVDKSRSKVTGGTGLGLAIVKHIIAQHHAELEIESEVGKGTKISVKFKL